MANEFIYWYRLQGLPISVQGEGREIGTVEDFYYRPGTSAIQALRVNAGVQGYHVLLASAIAAIERDQVIVANSNMLIPEANAGPVYQLPRGDKLLGYRVLTEDGREVGTIGNLRLGIYPPVALRIAAFELLGSRASFSAHEITSFDNDTLTIIEQEGKRIR